MQVSKPNDKCITCELSCEFKEKLKEAGLAAWLVFSDKAHFT